MNVQYQPLYRQAATMQHKFHDFSHPMANDPMANVLRNEMHNLTNDLAANKNPRQIERRLKGIQTQIRQTQMRTPLNQAMPGQGPVLNMNQANFLHSNFEKMRTNVRQNFNF